jgi:Protein of unknown function (DUF2652)
LVFKERETQTEIEHADTARSFLLETIIEKLGYLLTISKLEGDAVFAYVEESKLQEAKSLLELIDQTYLAFRDKALTLYQGSTCLCRACQALPTLDLKFIVHHSEFILQQTESYEHLGEVETYIMDMHVRYEEMKGS